MNPLLTFSPAAVEGCNIVLTVLSPAQFSLQIGGQLTPPEDLICPRATVSSAACLGGPAM